MKGMGYIGLMDAIQSVDRDRTLGEFSEAEIAARQAQVMRTSVLFSFATALLAAFDRRQAARPDGALRRVRQV